MNSLFPAKYLIRLDDACPTMKSENWDFIERVLDRYNIKPIVAVIPDNQFENLKFNSPQDDFWQRVQGWQNKNWSIALHGHQHQLHDYTGDEEIVPFRRVTEFAGLSLEEQEKKIQQAMEIFSSHNISPQAWVAPAHSFDQNTLEALKNKTSIRVVSDGLAISPYFKNEFLFVPQQLWSLQWRPLGIWTVCLHPNNMNQEQLAELEVQIKKFSNHFISLEDITHKSMASAQKNYFDSLYEKNFWLQRRLRRVLSFR